MVVSFLRAAGFIPAGQTAGINPAARLTPPLAWGLLCLERQFAALGIVIDANGLPVADLAFDE